MSEGDIAVEKEGSPVVATDDTSTVDLQAKVVQLEQELQEVKSELVQRTRQEHLLLLKLASREKDHNELQKQLRSLKKSFLSSLNPRDIGSPDAITADDTLVDPAINLVFHKMRNEVATAKKQVDAMQEEMSAWKFSADSATGKKLMTKIRLLYKENEELGTILETGKVASKENEMCLQRKFTDEVRKSQKEIDQFLSELDRDMEGLQETVILLQKQLRDAQNQIKESGHQKDKEVTEVEMKNDPEPELEQKPESNKEETREGATPTENDEPPVKKIRSSPQDEDKKEDNEVTKKEDDAPEPEGDSDEKVPSNPKVENEEEENEEEKTSV